MESLTKSILHCHLPWFRQLRLHPPLREAALRRLESRPLSTLAIKLLEGTNERVKTISIHTCASISSPSFRIQSRLQRISTVFLHLISLYVMSAAPASGAAPAAKAVTRDKNAEPTKDAKLAAALEEDDEFEDFPVESMSPSCSACWRHQVVAGGNMIWDAIADDTDGRLDTRRYRSTWR